jgi:hypothetical protein|tara:strand:- start:622 stop:747 length:126 start_codon:yes stop_codon:yes gene_type:complete
MVQQVIKSIEYFFGKASVIEEQPKGLLGLRLVDSSWYSQEE